MCVHVWCVCKARGACVVCVPRGGCTWVFQVQHAVCACAQRVGAVRCVSGCPRSCAYRWPGHRAAVLSPGSCPPVPGVLSLLNS